MTKQIKTVGKLTIVELSDHDMRDLYILDTGEACERYCVYYIFDYSINGIFAEVRWTASSVEECLEYVGVL